MAILPPCNKKIVKKRTKAFKRFQSDRFKRLDVSWRKPKGIDNRVRRRFKSTPRMPKIGYRTAKETRDVLPCGYRKFLVRRVEDLDKLLMQNKSICAEIYHAVSAVHRKDIVKRAEELGIHITNKNARLYKAEAESS